MIKLFEHQAKGIELLAEHDSFGLFWDMGSGKTLTMLIHLSNLVLSGEVETILWLAPKSALGAVDRDLDTMEAQGLAYRSEALRGRIVLMNYEKLSRKDSKHRKLVDNTEFDAIVMDEAHCLARPTSNRSKYVIGTGRSKGLINRIKYRYAMTGTPVTNSRLEDFWSFMMTVTGGNYYNYPSFEREYLKTHFLPGTYVKVIDGYRNAVALRVAPQGHGQHSGFGQQGVQAFAAFVALFELGGFALQLFVAQGLVRRFQLQDLVHDRLNVFQLTVAVGTKNFIKKSHTLLPFGNEFLDTLIVEVYHSISLYAKGKTRFSRQTGHFYRLFINIQQDIVP